MKCWVCDKLVPRGRYKHCSLRCKNQAADRRRKGKPINNRDAKLWRTILRLHVIGGRSA